MLHPQRKTMDLVPLVCLCLLTWSAGTAADHKPVVVYVEQGSDVILPCSLSTQQSLTDGFFEWKKDQKQVFLYDGGDHSNNDLPGQDEQFKGRVIYFSDQLKNGSASIMIRNTQLDDSGNYTCDFPRLQPPQTFYIKLVVDPDPQRKILKDRSDKNIGAAKPYVKLVKTDDGVLLQCEVKGVSPKPKVEWKDSAGNIIPAEEPQVTERGGSYDVILQATVTKTDIFTCVYTEEDNNHQISDWTYAAPNEPVVVYVEPGSDVVLPCSLSTQQSLTFKHFEWKKDQKQVFFYDGGDHSNNHPTGQDEQFNGRVFHFKDQLKNGIASIKIRNTQISDSGNYICVFPRLQPPQTFHIKLFVGAAAKPSLKQVLTKDGVVLQCEVKGASPKPKVEWKDSAGNILPAEEPQVTERGGSYDVILQAPLTKTDNFTCVVTQEEIKHQISDWTYAASNDSTGWIGTVVGTVFITLFVVGVIFAVLKCMGYIPQNCKKEKKRGNPQEEVQLQSNPNGV